MKYREKIKVVDAIQWLGFNLPEIRTFVGDRNFFLNNEKLVVEASLVPYVLDHSDWLIKEDDGLFYTVTHDLFVRVYEENT